jgi:hypothetical protein
LFKNEKPLLDGRKRLHFKVSVISSSFPNNTGVGISTCLVRAGCYGFFGPIPSTVLDKKKYFFIKVYNSDCKDKIKVIKCNY